MRPACMIVADISPDFIPSPRDAAIMRIILPHEATPKAIRKFSKLYRGLSDYGYWFLLSTLWVSYTGHSDINLWRRLFQSLRPNRDTSLMKPSELAVWRALPEEFTAFRAHRPNETDWIAYTTDPQTAARFALERGVTQVSVYVLRKADALCVFLRRGESEILHLDNTKARFVRTIPVGTVEDSIPIPQ